MSGHLPVMLKEVVATLAPRDDATYLDCTFGGGGYAAAILDSAPRCTLYAMDRDPDAIARGAALAARYAPRLHLIEGRFGDMLEHLAARGVTRDDARELVKQGVHPSHARQSSLTDQFVKNANTFEAVSREWLERKKEKWTPYYHKQATSCLEQNAFSKIGRLPIRNVTAAHLLEILQAMERRGAETYALQLRQWCSAIFRHAVVNIAEGITRNNADFIIGRTDYANINGILRNKLTSINNAARLQRCCRIILRIPRHGAGKLLQLGNCISQLVNSVSAGLRCVAVVSALTGNLNAIFGIALALGNNAPVRTGNVHNNRKVGLL